MEFSPNEVRELVLADHAALRIRLELLRRAVREADTDRNPAALCDLLPSVLDQLSSHLELQDRVLAPVLQVIDAWGPERASRLGEEHAAQRAWIEESRLRLEQNRDDAGRLAVLARAMIERVEKHIAEEEDSVLCADILTDGVIQIDFGG